MSTISDCCSTLFDGFTFSDIRTAQPPSLSGVYTVQIIRRGQPILAIIEQVNQLANKIDWSIITKRIRSRMNRLTRIDVCNTIYIGSAGTYAGSKNTLRGRYEEFAGRHTIMLPLWALLASDWELIYGWFATEQASRVEEELKQMYKQRHGNQLPALVHR